MHTHTKGERERKETLHREQITITNTEFLALLILVTCALYTIWKKVLALILLKKQDIAIHYITIHCYTLHDISLHYNTLQYITLHFITLQYIAIHYITFHYITLHFITLQYIAIHYITVHYITTHCNTLHYIDTLLQRSFPTSCSRSAASPLQSQWTMYCWTDSDTIWTRLLRIISR